MHEKIRFAGICYSYSWLYSKPIGTSSLAGRVNPPPISHDRDGFSHPVGDYDAQTRILNVSSSERANGNYSVLGVSQANN